MKYQEKVECAQDKAQEEFDNCMGDILDSTKEQLETDRGNGFYYFLPTDIKYLLRSVTICNHLSISITIYHYLSINHYLPLSIDKANKLVCIKVKTLQSN